MWKWKLFHDNDAFLPTCFFSATCMSKPFTTPPFVVGRKRVKTIISSILSVFSQERKDVQSMKTFKIISEYYLKITLIIAPLHPIQLLQPLKQSATSVSWSRASRAQIMTRMPAHRTRKEINECRKKVRLLLYSSIYWESVK